MPANIEGYQESNCIQMTKKEKVCISRNVENGKCYLFLKNEKSKFVWPVACWMGDTTNFEALKDDLDNDGKEELIVAHYDAMSNGIGICYWTIYVFEYPIGKNQPLEFSVEDYGPTAFHKTDKTGFEILATEWLLQSCSPENKGNYFIGRWFLYDKGMLLPQSNKPILMRRNTYKFEDIRNNYSEFGTPEKSYPYCFPVYTWLNSSSSKRTQNEPFYLKDKYKLKTGIVQKAERVMKDESYKMMVNILFDKEEIFTYGRKEDTENYCENYFNRIGDQKTGRLYPFDYVPSNPDKWLKGKKVELKEYMNSQIPRRGDEFRVLWVAN
jgi:hypothetical protein